MTNYPLPLDVQHAIKDEQVSNLGLLMHKLISYKIKWKMEGKDKAQVWKNQIIDKSISIFQTEDMKNTLKGMHERLDLIQNSYATRGLAVLKFRMNVDWRLVIGLGTASVLDTGISLQRIYGIPYIPGSAIKGVTRHHRLTTISEELGVFSPDQEEIKEKEQKTEKRETPWEMLEKLLIASETDEQSKKAIENNFYHLQNQQLQTEPNGIKQLNFQNFQAMYATAFRHAFGSTAHQGNVIFFDAFPEKLMLEQKPILELDIINTHYQQYYMEGKPPADYLSPIPVYFIAIRGGTPFQFRLVAKDQKTLDLVHAWLKKAGQESGIGAKTMAGYGAMSPMA